MPKNKIVVIGAGNVGSTTAMRLAGKSLGDIVMIDIAEGRAAGKALDIMQSGPIEYFSSRVKGTDDFSQMAHARIVVMTAGFPRKPGMTREDLLSINGKIIRETAAHIKNYCPDAIVIVVTNPMDAMAYTMFQATGFSKERVIGMGGALDSARLAYFISEKLGVSCSDIDAVVIGAHSNQMVPLATYTRVKKIPLAQLLDKEAIAALFDRTRNAGAEIVGLLKAGSAYYATSSAIMRVVLSIVRDEKLIIPSSVLLEGEYDLNDLYCGVPARIGTNGCEEIIMYDLTEAERAALYASAQTVKDALEACVSPEH